MIDITHRELLYGLIEQVSRAAAGEVETAVTTYISRPLWEEWLKATNAAPGTEPTEWLGIHETHRVYGSRTVILDSPAMFAVSLKE